MGRRHFKQKPRLDIFFFRDQVAVGLDHAACTITGDDKFLMEDPPKLAHTLVLDAGPIILNQPPVSTLIAHAHEIVTLPSIVDEIKDAAARNRLETTLKPFLKLRTPRPESILFVQNFAKKTGDLSVLSRNDLHLIALAYEVELERNDGDWRLRKVPGQKRVNGPAPARNENQDPSQAEETTSNGTEPQSQDTPNAKDLSESLEQSLTLTANGETSEKAVPVAQEEIIQDQETSSASDSDSEGWITPSNLAKHQANDAGASPLQTSDSKMMQVATLTTDFAMQNVLLQINLNLVSPSLHRVRHLKTFIKRCHACFQLVKEMDKQFCPRCGKDTLTKVACSTNAQGEFQIHLKTNMQWNNRGNRYSVPKPVPGSASGKVEGGGKSGWGNQLILSEDQKEYVRALSQEKRSKQRDLMDEDYLPSILSGERARTGGRPKVGAGRNVNSKKRR